jgi:hypothetical protein
VRSVALSFLVTGALPRGSITLTFSGKTAKKSFALEVS